MGEVYAADQLEPVRRRVALKLIKRGMDSKQVLARFELEGMLWDARVWVAPAEWVTDHATVRIASVDPSTSGFFDTNTGEPEL